MDIKINDISIDDIIKIYNLYKKPSFCIKHSIVRIGEFLNSYGNFEALLKDMDNNEDGNLSQLKYLYKFDKCDDDLHYCLVGKIGYINMFKLYFKWIYKYFNERKDLDIIRRIYITAKKSYKYLYRYNYNTCIDVGMYLYRQDYWNSKIKEMFDNKKIDRLNLYKYNIEKKLI